jgi:hypothetical protein
MRRGEEILRPVHEELRRDLTMRFEADQRALAALYAAADSHRDDFYRCNEASDTPWPFAILEWQPEDQAPPLVVAALSQVRSNTGFLRELVADVGWPGSTFSCIFALGRAWR